MEGSTSSLFVGKNLISLAEVDSTNNYLKSLAEKQELPEGTVVTAENQFAGRGQRSNTWESEPGKNVIISVLLYPRFLSAQQQFLLSQTIALSVCSFISQLLPKDDIAIKWPNDIYVNNKKIAGILIESSWMGSQLKNSIIGIGININQDQFNNPAATSIKKLSQKEHELPALHQSLFSFIEAKYLQLKSGAYAQIKKDYIFKLYQYNIESNYIDAITNDKFTGTITGITDKGKLMISTQNGIKEFDMKEVQFV